MAKNQKQFVLEVVEQLMADGKPILASHKLPSKIVSHLVKRPDVLGKLASVLVKSKVYAKGYKGLKRQSNFKIAGFLSHAALLKGYEKEFNSFSKRFANFEPKNNVLVFALQKDEPSGDTAADIKDMKSVGLTWNKAIDKSAKIAGALYVVVMWGDDYFRPKEEKFAEVKLKINLRKENKRTPEKIKAELKRKATAKIKRLNSQLRKLNTSLASTENTISNYQRIASDLGIEGDLSNKVLNKKLTSYDKSFNKTLAKAFSPQDIAIIEKAREYYNKGSIRGMHKTLSTLSNADAYELAKDYVIKGLDSKDNLAYDYDDVVKINKLQRANAKLKQRLAQQGITPKDRGNANFALRSNKERIKNILNKRQLLDDNISYDENLQKRQAIKKLIANKQALRNEIENRYNQRIAKYQQVPYQTVNQLQNVQQVYNDIVDTTPAQVPYQNVVTPQQNPRISKLLDRRAKYQNIVATAQNAKKRGNAAFYLRKINKQLQQLGVPSDVVNSQQVPVQFQVAPQQSVVAKNSTSRLQRLKTARQRQLDRINNGMSAKVKGNARFALKNIEQKMKALGYSLPKQQQLAPQILASQQKPLKRSVADLANIDMSKKSRIDAILGMI